MDYKVELTISHKLRVDCVQLFDQCAEFDTPATLRSFASITELKLVIGCIPKSDRIEYNELISNMLKQRRPSSEPVLFDLLEQLALQYQEDGKGIRFDELKEHIRCELVQGENPEQEKDYQRLVEDSSSSDGHDVDESARRWIDDASDDLDELALRITLAVFNGTAFEVIERAKNDLLKSLQELLPPPLPNPEHAPPAVPHVPLMRRLAKAGAKETVGKPPDWRRVVELETPQLTIEAIGYVWQLHRETRWRQKLIEWLTKYAAGRSADVRTRAAVAAGRLAVKDYRFVRDNLLYGWVRKNDPQFRTAIGMALGVLVREEDLAGEVQSLLWKWSESTEEDERWAAMRAYIYVGAYCRPVGEVMTRWRKIAASELVAVHIQIADDKWVRLNNPLHMSLMDAMARFFFYVAHLPTEEKRLHFTAILAELKKWIAAKEADAWLGCFMFTTLGWLMVTSVESEEIDSPPVLLQLVEGGPEQSDYRKQLAGLFDLALRNGATIIVAKELLCEWLSWANGLQDNLQLYESRIQTLLRDIIAEDRGGRMRGKVTACLRDCGRNSMVERVLAEL